MISDTWLCIIRMTCRVILQPNILRIREKPNARLRTPGRYMWGTDLFGAESGGAIHLRYIQDMIHAATPTIARHTCYTQDVRETVRQRPVLLSVPGNGSILKAFGVVFASTTWPTAIPIIREGQQFQKSVAEHSPLSLLVGGSIGTLRM